MGQSVVLYLIADMRTLTFIIFVLAIIPETITGINKRQESHICKFKEKVNETECKIKIIEKDEKIKKKANCKTKKNKRKGQTIVFDSILPTNQECEGLVFNISLKLPDKKGKKTKVIDVNWQKAEDKTEDCSLEKIMKKLPNHLNRQTRNGKEQSAFWMKRVSGWRRIHELSIPGTHDTMAYQGTFATIWHRCQSISLRSQLEKGARFFDIRLGVRHGSYLGAYHGDGWKKAFLNSYFYQIMSEFNRFLNAHPSEGIIFRYKDETGDPGDFCGIFNRRVSPYKNKIWTSGGEDTYPRLRDIRGKIVILEINKDCDYGYKWEKRGDFKDLDNYEGGAHNPFTNRRGTTDLVDWDWIWNKKVYKRDTEENVFKNETVQDQTEEDVSLNETVQDQTGDFSQNENIQDQIIQILLEKENYFHQDSPRMNSRKVVDPVVLESPEDFSQNETGENTHDNRSDVAIADITGSPSPLTDIDVKEIQRIVKNEESCNRNKTERIYTPRASDAYKNELTNALDQAKGTGFKNDMITIWASAVKAPWDPKFFARGVNPHLRRYLDFNWGRTGILSLDYITDWDSNMPFYVFRRNWSHSVCVRLYEHINLQGSSINIADEVRNAHHFGWGDRISSIWIAPGCRVFAYEHTHWGGHRFWTTNVRTYATALYDLRQVNHGGQWNDRISSMRCECYENYLPNI